MALLVVVMITALQKVKNVCRMVLVAPVIIIVKVLKKGENVVPPNKLAIQQKAVSRKKPILRERVRMQKGAFLRQ